MRETGLRDETIEILVSLTGEFGRAARGRAIHESLRALAGRAMAPRAPGGIGKRERVRDGLEALPHDDGAPNSGTAEDTSVLSLF